jgi:uncharacterized protein (UPF0332 family)
LTPEVAAFLAKAAKLLADGAKMDAVGLHEEAGRAAYMVAFHAAQAFLFARTGKVARTHQGVQSEFLRLTREEGGFDPDLRRFLSQSYNLKSIADYDTGPDAVVEPGRAAEALAGAGRFLAAVRESLG